MIFIFGGWLSLSCSTKTPTGKRSNFLKSLSGSIQTLLRRTLGWRARTSSRRASEARSRCSTLRSRPPALRPHSILRKYVATMHLLELTFIKVGIPNVMRLFERRSSLGPNDTHINTLAGRRALAKHHFVEAYKFFRKAHSAHSSNPNET